MKSIFCLLGPTCTGKSDIAIELAKTLPVEIVSVDSAMVYRELNIGTAKPSVECRNQITHHLIDICDPSAPYSAADFLNDVDGIIQDIFKREKFPLLTGGTMLYFKTLQQGLNQLPSANPEVRAKLQQKAKQFSWQYLHEELASVDPESAARIHPNDSQRMLRALEVFLITGKTITTLYKQPIKSSINQKECHLGYKLPYNIEWIGLMPSNRQLLHDVIQKRFLTMLDHGLVDEVAALFQRGDLHDQLPAIKSVGYRQVWQYLSGELTYNEMIERATIATRQLAKHQMTWMRSWPAAICCVDSHASNRLPLIKEQIHSIIYQV